MVRPVDPDAFVKFSETLPVVDVRAPVEFAQGHIPGAFNIPLFGDEERAEIGTLYHREGRDQALVKGLEVALPKTCEFTDRLRQITRGPSILLHCWRGGMRSASMAEVFSAAGYDVILLTGGYKAYRRFIREELARPARVMVLGGYTGSGKTSLLSSLAAEGEQVIDLEHLACHKGSVFGALGQLPQPTNEQFENDFYRLWSRVDKTRPIWLEDESRRIGNVTLPGPLYDHISSGFLVMVLVPPQVRINRLVKEYSCFDKPILAAAIMKIAEQLGGARTREALDALDRGAYGDVASITLAYYDKAYRFAIERRSGKGRITLELDLTDPQADAMRILEVTRKTRPDGFDLP